MLRVGRNCRGVIRHGVVVALCVEAPRDVKVALCEKNAGVGELDSALSEFESL